MHVGLLRVGTDGHRGRLRIGACIAASAAIADAKRLDGDDSPAVLVDERELAHREQALHLLHRGVGRRFRHLCNMSPAIDIVEVCGKRGERAVLTAERNGVLSVGGERRGGIDHGEVVAIMTLYVARKLRGGGGGGGGQRTTVWLVFILIFQSTQVAVRQLVARRP